MNLLDNNLWNNPGIILVLIIVVFAIIALLVFFIRKLIFKNKKEDKPDEDTIVKEDLNRYLVDVDDEETKKEFEKFEKENENEAKDK